MKWRFAIAALMALALLPEGARAQTGTVKTMAGLIADVNGYWPDQQNGVITPYNARQTLLDMIATTFGNLPSVCATTTAITQCINTAQTFLAGTVSGATNLNTLAITEGLDSCTNGDCAYIDGWSFIHNINGGNGGRQSVQITSTVTAPFSAQSPNQFMGALQVNFTIPYSLGGTGAGNNARGQVFTWNPYMELECPGAAPHCATFIGEASTDEHDFGADSGTSVNWSSVLKLTTLGSHAVHAGQGEGYLVWTAGPGTAGLGNLMLFGSFAGGVNPFGATVNGGTVLATIGSPGFKYGIDFSGANPSGTDLTGGFPFRSLNYSVDWYGNVVASSITGSGESTGGPSNYLVLNAPGQTGSAIDIGDNVDATIYERTTTIKWQNFAASSQYGQINSAGLSVGSTTGAINGVIAINGSTSGVITAKPQAAAGTYNWNWPTAAGSANQLLTSQGGSSTAMTWTSPTVTVNSVACTLGSTCTISAAASLVAGSTTITGTCTNGNFLFNNSGVLGCQAGSGAPSIIGTPTNGQIAQWTGASSIQGISTIAVANGGTGQSTLTANSFLVGNGTTAISQVVLTGLVLGNGASAPTSYAGATCTNQFISALNASGSATCTSVTNAFLTAGTFSAITGVGTLTAGATGAGFTVALGTSTITGQLGVANGGTGDATLTSNGVLYGNGTSAVQATAQGGANTILVANAGAPSFTASPVIGTQLTVPLIYGGTAANAQLFIATTSSGAAMGDVLDFLGSQIFFQNPARSLTWMSLGPTLGQMFVTGLASTSGVVMCFNTSNNQVGQCTSITAATTINTGVSGVVLTLENSAATCTHTPTTGSETVSCSSDQRLKTDIRDAPSVLADLMTYRVRQYRVIADGSTQIGPVAQEMEQRHPDMVHAGEQFLTVDQVNPWRVVKALQELKAENDNLRAANDNLALKVERLESLEMGAR